MKRSDSVNDIISEFDFDSFAEEMDILFGDRFGAASVVSNYVNTNVPKYSEERMDPRLIENEDEIKEANRINGFTHYEMKDSRFHQ